MDRSDIIERLAGLAYEVMESHDVTHGDMTSGDAWFLGPAERGPDGGLTWSLEPVDGEGPGDEPYDEPYDVRSWMLSAEDVALGGFVLPWLDISVEEPKVEAGAIEALAGFLSKIAAHDTAFRAAIAEQAMSVNGDLIADLFEFLPPDVLDELFSGVASAEAMTGEIFARGLRLCRIGFHPDGISGDAAKAIIADYRFLTAKAPPGLEDEGEDEIAPTHGGLHDATGQALAVYADLDGRPLDVVHES